MTKIFSLDHLGQVYSVKRYNKYFGFTGLRIWVSSSVVYNFNYKMSKNQQKIQINLQFLAPWKP